MKLWTERRTWQSRHARDKLAVLEPGTVRRIAVIKHAAFGDLLLTRPFLVTLREHFPHAELTLSVISHYQRGTPEDLVDRVHVVPSRKEKPGMRATLASYRALGEQDLLFDLTTSTRSMVMSRLARAGFKAGFFHRGWHRFTYDAAIARADFRYEAETFLELLHLLGIPYASPLRFDMPVEALIRPRPYVVYFPTASTPAKSWPAEHFAGLINQLAAVLPQHDHLVLSGLVPWERAVCEAIVAQTDPGVRAELVDAGPQDAALLKGAALMVGNDTGIRHLATAVGTPTVGIFFSTPPFGYWPRFGRHDVVYRLDGSVPAVKDVVAAVRGLMDV